MRAVGVVVKSVHSRGLVAALAALVVAAGTLFSASVASADSVQVQSYQRASQSEACVAQLGETPWQASWGTDSTWHPSWDQWANNGKGGWTCTRTIVWARTPVAAAAAADGSSSSVTYRVGDIGPGGGLVFLISGGLSYEMAPKNWGASETTGVQWCSDTTSIISGAVGTAVGTGSANTTAMLAFGCTSTAANAARAYNGGGLSDWFLPSTDELNAMCNYSRTWTGAPATGACTGVQNAAFAAGAYGFVSYFYWSSSESSGTTARYQNLNTGAASNLLKSQSDFRVRAIRAF